MHYAPAVVTLEGTLVRRGQPRRPSDAARSAPGSRADTVFLLVTSKPICVVPDSASDDTDRQAEPAVRELELAIGTDSVWSELAGVAQAPLRVTGELFRASPGHHPAVLLWVIRISPA